MEPQELEQLRRQILSSQGYDPDRFDFDHNTGEVFERSAPPKNATPATSAIGAFAANAAHNVPEALTGLGGAVAGGATGTALAGPIGGVVGGLVGGFGLPVAAEPLLRKAKEMMYPQAFQDYTAQAQAEHPIASTAGGVASGLIGLKPNLGNIATAGRGLRSVVAGVPWSRISAAQRAALPNVAIGAGLGGGITAAEEIANSDKPTFMEKLTDVNPANVALSTLGGAVLNEPNRLGRMIGLHATPEVDTGTRVPAPNARTGMAPTETERLPEPWRVLNTDLAREQGVDLQFKPEVRDDGELTQGVPQPVEGRYDPSTDPTRAAIAQVSEATGSFDAPPHEQIHALVESLANGTPGERAFIDRALQAFGGEEGLVQASGENFAGRFTGAQESIWRDLGSLIKDRFLRRGSRSDYANLLANILHRQGSQTDRGIPLPTAEHPQAIAAKGPSPETMKALRQLGFGEVSGEDAPQLIADINSALTKGAKRRAGDAAKLERAITASRQSLELLPEAERQPVLDHIARLERERRVLLAAEKVPQKVQELQLGSRTDLPPREGSSAIETSPLDTGERMHEETGFEGYQPPAPKMRVLKQPTEDAAWEREGGEYPQPFETPEDAAARKRAEDFALARREQQEQNAAEQSTRETLSRPGIGESIKNALVDRQMEGPIEAPRNKVTEFTRPEMYGEGRELPQEGPRTEAERIQDEMEGTRAKYKRPEVKDPPEGVEGIRGVAIRLEDGSILDAPSKYHGYIHEQLSRRFGGYDNIPKLQSGFVTTKGRFVSREEAALIAVKAKQVWNPEYNLSERNLISEDLMWKDQAGLTSHYKRFGATREQTDELPRRVNLNPFAGEATKLERGGPDHAKLAASWREAYDQMRANRGKYANPMIGAMDSLRSPESKQRVYETLIEERRQNKDLRSTLASVEEQRAYDTIRSTLRTMAQDQIAAGQPIWMANGKKRTRGVDPHYFPNVIDSGVRRILSEGQSTKAFQDLKRDFIKHQIGAGISAAEAEKRFSNLLGTFSKSTAGNPFDFQAVRVQEGVGLPDSWIERDPVRAVRSYTSRFSRDRAAWDILEKNPHIMRMLGSDVYEGDKPIPKGVVAPNLVKDPHVQRLVDDFTGRNTEDEPIVAGATRLASAAIIGGPHTKIADILTSPFKALTYAAPGHRLDILRGILASPEGYRNAFTTGLNRRGGLVVAHDILGFGEQLNTKMTAVAEALTKYSGAEHLELVSRGISQSMGEAIGATHQKLAANGDAKSIEFLKQLGATPTTSRMELGTRIAQLLQGRYDATNLPHAITHGKLAPFAGLLRWSVEQTNNFERFVIEPALKGDFMPAVVSLVAGITGGALINEIREMVSTKKQYSANWNELRVGYGKPGWADAVRYKLLAAAQVTGTAGILSELAKQTYELASGRSVQGFNYPALSVVGDVSSRAIAVVRAIEEGGDAGEILQEALKDTLKKNVQAYRLARNHLGRHGLDRSAQLELQKSDAVRDQSVWERMEGKSVITPTTPPVDYTKLGEKRYNEAAPRDAARMVPSLVRDAVRDAHGDPTELEKNLNRLRTIKPYGMPSPKSNTLDFARYYKWLRDTSGNENTARVTKEYMTRAVENDLKRKLIPAFGVK